MNFIDARLKIRRFIKKNRRKVMIVVVAIAIIVAINYVLKNMPEEETTRTTYEPNIAVMDSSEVPEKWQDEIKNRIDTFITYCNEKNYQSAYDMISDDCKNALFPTIDDFKEYVDYKFQVKRIYSIQNFSNLSNQYIYNVNLMSDFMATGSTGTNYGYLQEKFVFTEDDKNLKFAIGDFIRKDTLNAFSEDENLKIVVESKNVYYDHEAYTVRITNKTENIAVLSDQSVDNEIAILVNNKYRSYVTSSDVKIVLNPEEENTYTFVFNKYCDDGYAPKGMYFNNVRILQSFSGTEETRQEELDNAIRNYSIIINFNVED